MVIIFNFSTFILKLTLSVLQKVQIMKSLIITTIILIFSIAGISQDFDLAVKAGGKSSDQGYDIVTGPDGDSYVCGWFSDTAWFGSQMLISQDQTDVFTARFDSTGILIWVIQGNGPGKSVAAGIDMDQSGNIFITGWFEDEIQFGEINLQCHGLYDMFVIKYNSEGDALWANVAYGEQDIYGNRICVNEDNNVIVSGSFRGTAGFGDPYFFESKGDRDIFVTKYDNNGALLWVRQFGGKGEDRGYGIDGDNNGNIYFTGFFNGKCSFDEYEEYSPAITSAYICKLNQQGETVWVEKLFGGANEFARGYGLGTDADQNVFVNGFFSGSLNVAYQDTLYATGGQYDQDAYTVKFNTDGLLLWADNAGSVHNDQCRDLIIDQQGNCYITGFYNSLAKFGEMETETEGQADIFVAMYQQEGNISWLKSAGGTKNDYAYGISPGQNNNVYLTGIFTGEADFEDHHLEGWGGHDIFIAGLNSTGSGIKYGTFPHEVTVFPNPAGDLLHVEINNRPFNHKDLITLQIHGINGKILKKEKLEISNSNQNISFKINDLASGAYFLNLYNKTGSCSVKFVIE